MVLETMWFRAACLGFFPPFPHYFILSSLLGDFCYFRGIFAIFGGKRGFLAFWRHFKPFGGFLNGFMAFWRHFRPFGGFLVGFSGKYGSQMDK